MENCGPSELSDDRTLTELDQAGAPVFCGGSTATRSKVGVGAVAGRRPSDRAQNVAVVLAFAFVILFRRRPDGTCAPIARGPSGATMWERRENARITMERGMT